MYEYFVMEWRGSEKCIKLLKIERILIEEAIKNLITPTRRYYFRNMSQTWSAEISPLTLATSPCPWWPWSAHAMPFMEMIGEFGRTPLIINWSYLLIVLKTCVRFPVVYESTIPGIHRILIGLDNAALECGGTMIENHHLSNLLKHWLWAYQNVAFLRVVAVDSGWRQALLWIVK